MTLDLTRHPLEVARDLLGWTVVCRGTAAVLTELEAYHESEEACHCFGGRVTARTQAMFEQAGTAYVYFTYGMHWCANIVTGSEGEGAAVLLRSAVPVHGEELMHERRGGARELLTGPARLTQALDIRGADTGRMTLASVTTVAEALEGAQDGPVLVHDAAAAGSVGIELPLPEEQVLRGPRIGISRAVDLEWRLGVAGVRLSRGFGG